MKSRYAAIEERADLLTARRARPALGTFVEISATAPRDVNLSAAIEAAFAAIEHVQKRMSFHDSASDVSALNRSARLQAVQVDPATTTVLQHALDFFSASQGRFDVSIAPILIRRGVLPGTFHPKEAGATSADIELCSGNRVRFRRALQIDLGGIAKGYAVDCAVAALQAHGAHHGVVNAGGDLRVFGEVAQKIAVRHPSAPGHLLELTELKNAALATSASYDTDAIDALATGAHIDGRTRQVSSARASVSVVAPTCMAADALCKIVFIDPEFAEHLLPRYGAIAYRIESGHHRDAA